MKKFKNCLLLSLVLVFAFFYAGCSLSKTASSSIPSDRLVVSYIDIGQGDSQLVQVNGKNLLIDSGPGVSNDKLFSFLNSKNIKKLDYVIATHPHEDHIGNLPDVIKKFSIGAFYAPKVSDNTKIFGSLVAVLKSKGIQINIAKAGETLDLGKDVSCEFLAPNSSKYDNINNYSAILKLTYKTNVFLFEGDAEKLSENEMLSKGYNLKADVIKLGHHGSHSSSSSNFMAKANPQIAIISCGKNNEYGHPHKETITQLKNKKITTYRTDIDGTITLISDGTSIKKQ